MKSYLGIALIWLSIASGACSSNDPANTLADLGAPGDLDTGDAAAEIRDLSRTLADLGTPSDLSTKDPAIAWNSLNFVAGGLGGPGNADDIGRLARFHQPSGLVADGAGNFYVVDTLNYTIRKIVLATGEVSTIAGTAGIRGTADGTGAAAQFSYPTALATDGAGNLYIADTGPYTIRKLVLATGQVSTLAGIPDSSGSTDGPGATALFRSPVGLTVDGAGNLYVVDSVNNNVRKIVLATAVVSTVAGTTNVFGSADGIGTAAQFSRPAAVAADGAGNLYVADTENSTIRKIVLATGTVSTIAGTVNVYGSTDGTGAAALFNHPSVLAADGAGNLYIGDTYNCTIRKLVLATYVVSTLAGTAGSCGSGDGAGPVARLGSVSGLVLDGTGNAYVTDEGFTLRKIVLATGEVSTVAGSAQISGYADGTGAAAQFDRSFGVAADGAGNFYVADSDNRTIRKVVLATGEVSTLAGSPSNHGYIDGPGATASFGQPMGLASDGSGNLYVADRLGQTIRKVVLSTGVVSTLAGNSGRQGTSDGIGAAARFVLPRGVATDRAGNLYVCDSLTVRKIDPATGLVSTLAGNPKMGGNVDGIGPSAQFGEPWGLTADGMGNLYVANTYYNAIRKVVVATGAVSTLACPQCNYPAGVISDGPSTLYVANNGDSTLLKINLTTGFVSTLAGMAGQSGIKVGPLPARLNSPDALTLMPTGELIIIDEVENAVLALR